MAVIQDDLVLNDRYSRTVRDYINLMNRAGNAVSRAQNSTRLFGNSAASAARQTSGLVSQLSNLAKAYIGIQGVTALTGLSDSITSTTARLNLMNDGLQTTEELSRKIYESAQRSRGSYLDTASAVSKMAMNASAAFNSNDEVIAFMEQVNKQFVIGGASAEEQRNAITQLTQAMAAGALRGEELNSILDQAPGIARAIESYMGVAEGSIKRYAEQGLITANVVKNAMFDAARETNKAFESMPMTWSQVWTSMQNTAIMALQPVLNAVNWLANNLAIIGPLVAGLGTSFAVFLVAANSAKIAAAATTAYKFALDMLKFGYAVLTKQTYVATAATARFTGTLLANPITWVVGIVLLLVAALYAGVAAFNKLTGSSVSATGIITGALAAALAFVGNVVAAAGTIIYNAIASIYNVVAAVANFIGNVFNDPIGSVARLFFDLADTVLGILQTLAGAIDTLFNFNLSDAVQGWRNSLGGWVDKTFGKGDEVMAQMELKSADRFVYKDAFTSGYKWGSELFGSSTSDLFAQSEAYESIAAIADSVSGIEKSVAMTDEDLKSLVDVAERRYVNNVNLTAQTPVINITGQNTGNTTADRQAIANTIRDILIEQVAAGSTRTTARAF